MMFRDGPGAVLVSMDSAGPTWGYLDDQTSINSLGGGMLEVAGQTLSVTIATGSLPVRKGSTINIQATDTNGDPIPPGTTYLVRYPSVTDDGMIQILWLEQP